MEGLADYVLRDVLTSTADSTIVFRIRQGDE